MSLPLNRVTFTRQQDFKPDVIWSLTFCGSNFSRIQEQPEVYAEKALTQSYWERLTQER